MKKAAVLGHPIDHSLSPVLHNAGYQALELDHWEYGRYDCQAEELPALIDSLGKEYQGFSVTMPAKFAALEYATIISARARAIGSANTLLRQKDGSWFADNTDVDGVKACIDQLNIDNPNTALIIGAGGTARPAFWALASSGISTIYIMNRTNKEEEFLSLAHAAGNIQCIFLSYKDPVPQVDLVISTVPSAVLEGQEERFAIAPVIDVIYNPWPTPLIQVARKKGYQTVGGHIMLIAQAYGQFKLFTGHNPPCEAMWDALVNAVPDLRQAREEGTLGSCPQYRTKD